MALENILQQLQQERRQAAQTFSYSQERSRAMLRAAQEKIKAGESTGDPITDYVILHSKGNQEAEEKINRLHRGSRKAGEIKRLYRSLQENENGLVAVEEVYKYSFLTCYEEMRSSYFVYLQMGKIRKPFLRIKHLSQDEDQDKKDGWCFGDAAIAPNPSTVSYAEGIAFHKGHFPVIGNPKIYQGALDISLHALLKEHFHPYHFLLDQHRLYNQSMKERISMLGSWSDWRGFHSNRDYIRLDAYKIHVGTKAVDKRFKGVLFSSYGDHGAKIYENNDFYQKARELLLSRE